MVAFFSELNDMNAFRITAVDFIHSYVYAYLL